MSPAYPRPGEAHTHTHTQILSSPPPIQGLGAKARLKSAWRGRSPFPLSERVNGDPIPIPAVPSRLLVRNGDKPLKALHLSPVFPRPMRPHHTPHSPAYPRSGESHRSFPCLSKARWGYTGLGWGIPTHLRPSTVVTETHQPVAGAEPRSPPRRGYTTDPHSRCPDAYPKRVTGTTHTFPVAFGGHGSKLTPMIPIPAAPTLIQSVSRVPHIPVAFGGARVGTHLHDPHSRCPDVYPKRVTGATHSPCLWRGTGRSAAQGKR